jgi:hypothetical protein
MAGAACALAVLDRIDVLSPASLQCPAFALGIGTALNNFAWQAIQPEPELVPRHELAPGEVFHVTAARLPSLPARAVPTSTVTL